jgi:hypothetical protein
VNPNFGKTNLCVSCWLPHFYLDTSILACVCHIGGATWLLVFVILKPYTKFGSSQTSKHEGEEVGSHCQANPVAPDLQNWWHQFLAVWLFHCERACPEIPEISLEIPDFPETPESPGFTDKFVLSGDFSGLAYSPPL